MKKLFYIKKGRRYVPVHEYDSELMDSFPKGAHLVMCYPGGKSTHFNIDPAYAPMIAAGRVAEDAVARAIFLASEARPRQQVISERQRAAWEEMKAAFGDEFFSIEFASTRDLAEAAVKAMQEQAEELMSHAGVRNAYEQFQLMCNLTKEKQNGS